uniref:Homeobox_KN domain-containing protein n=1 Tax=Elaeophora elaphi TaxID=1147741 RepID=A0A0R3RP02_9BILA
MDYKIIEHHFGENYQLSNGTTNDYSINSMSKQHQQQQKQQHQNHGITVIPLSLSTDSRDITTTTIANTNTTTIITTTTTTSAASPVLMMSLTKKRGIFPKPATNIMRAWLFHHLTFYNKLDDTVVQQNDQYYSKMIRYGRKIR